MLSDQDAAKKFRVARKDLRLMAQMGLLPVVLLTPLSSRGGRFLVHEPSLELLLFQLGILRMRRIRPSESAVNKEVVESSSESTDKSSDRNLFGGLPVDGGSQMTAEEAREEERRRREFNEALKREREKELEEIRNDPNAALPY